MQNINVRNRHDVYSTNNSLQCDLGGVIQINLTENFFNNKEGIT